ncbi:MAG: alpha/beta fold hydrolase [Anaerolineae bacterium]
MIRRKARLSSMVTGLLMVAVGLGAMYASDGVLSGAEHMRIPVAGDDTLVGTYYPGSRPAGILLLEGFGSDQVTMRSAAGQFAQAGWHVFTFDFSGHGRSPGALTFDNAATDRLARQVLAAQRLFRGTSGLADGQIVWLGHSMGARVALQATTLVVDQPAGLVLLGTQVNLGTNVQSEVFTGVRDVDLAWVQALGPEMPETPVLLISGTWDDILTPDAARVLFRKLGGDASASPRTLRILPRLLHNYEVFSPRVLSLAKTWVGETLGVPITPSASLVTLRLVGWFVALVGLFVAVVSGERWVRVALSTLPSSALPVQLVDVGRFLRAKYLLWLAALPLSALVLALFYVLPWGVPVFNLIYVGFIGGYGLLMRALYALGWVPGTEGRWSLRPARPQAGSPRRPLAALGVMAVLLLAVTLYARSGWCAAPPTDTRLLWLALFTPLTALGFRIGRWEQAMLAQAAPNESTARWLLTLSGLLPFFLWSGFQLAIGSLSGLVGGVQGLIILALVLVSGALIQRVAGRPWVTALFEAVLLYWLVLPQGVLFW